MRKHLTSAQLLGAAVFTSMLAAGCSQKAAYRDGIDDQALIPLRYPQSAMTVGALGWGKPGGPITSFRPGPDNISDELLEAMPTADAAWFGEKKSSKVYMDVVAQPGPEILNAINIGGAKVDTGVAREKMRFVDWGTLKERSVDPQRMSEAVVRGWYNMPGEAVRLDALAAMRPDVVEYENRPWLVQRSVSAENLKYEVSSELSGRLGVAAKDPIYGKGEVGTGFETENGTTLNVKKPMVIGYNTMELKKVEPPLPPIGMDAQPGQLSTHTFTWKIRGHSGTVKTQVDPVVLRALARKNGFEASLPAPVVQNVVTQVQGGQPVRASVVGEVKPKEGPGSWSIRGEGATVTGNDLLRLRINLAEDAFVYILNKDSAGEAVVLYPKVAGQDMSRGQDAVVKAGDFNFPTSVIGVDGFMLSNDPNGGTESFLVVVSKTQLPGLPKAMADFAAAATTQARSGNSVTRDAGFAFTEIPRAADPDSLTRVAVGYANATSASASPDLPPPANVSFPTFSGLGTATVVTLNLKKTPSR